MPTTKSPKFGQKISSRLWQHFPGQFFFALAAKLFFGASKTVKNCDRPPVTPFTRKKTVSSQKNG
jgi:hypothetical protein